MNCPICGERTKVIDSRFIKNRVTRTRECPECMTRFRTFEGMDFNSIPEYLKDKVSR